MTLSVTSSDEFEESSVFLATLSDSIMTQLCRVGMSALFDGTVYAQDRFAVYRARTFNRLNR